jgi:hypothetical protein
MLDIVSAAGSGAYNHNTHATYRVTSPATPPHRSRDQCVPTAPDQVYYPLNGSIWFDGSTVNRCIGTGYEILRYSYACSMPMPGAEGLQR